MYAQYSTISVQIFVSFIYGVACPILFVITFISLLIMYTFERMNLAYWHPKPPMYGKAMNTQVLSLLKWAPLAMLMSLFWILGNNQMFGNELALITTSHGVVDPLHPLITINSGLKADSMILVLIPLYLLFKVAFAMFSSGKRDLWN
jgi:hypothetical protein